MLKDENDIFSSVLYIYRRRWIEEDHNGFLNYVSYISTYLKYISIVSNDLC